MSSFPFTAAATTTIAANFTTSLLLLPLALLALLALPALPARLTCAIIALSLLALACALIL
jgi:hypothetical protein